MEVGGLGGATHVHIRTCVVTMSVDAGVHVHVSVCSAGIRVIKQGSWGLCAHGDHVQVLTGPITLVSPLSPSRTGSVSVCTARAEGRI